MAEGRWRNICRIVWRKRVFEPEPAGGGNLKRCLNVWDLTSLGVGSTLGIGVYVLVGAVAMKHAGPSILLSFLIAAITSFFAGLCYAELGSRVPLAGSAFIYTYVTVGELVAFMVGWNNILEFVFGTASVARGLSSYFDVVVEHSMSSWFQAAMPLPNYFGISPYFDLLAFTFVLLMGVMLSFGVRESSIVNNVFSTINISVMIFIVIAGAFKVNPANWSIPAEQVPSGYGDGGFFPYGFWGTLKGAAVCFYGFVGFDIINASGEEVKEPSKTIPIAILSCLSIVFAVYAGVSIVVTMMIPYYEMVAVAAVSTAFSQVGLEWARWIVIIGAVFGITTSLFGALFPLTRLLYSMAHDGLFIHWFARVSATRQSPVIATLIPTAVISLLAAFLELEQLILMMCIGTLFSYTIVATCVVLLRYGSDYESESPSNIIKQLIGGGDRKATRTTAKIINIAIIMFICTCLTIALVVVYAQHPLIPAIILHVLALLIVIVMALQPTNREHLAFKTPLVPFIPCVSIYTNLHLMVLINIRTWLRVMIWILIGIPIYLICITCYKQRAGKVIPNAQNNKPHATKNGKSPIVQIVVESPTPPHTLARSDEHPEQYDDAKEIHQELRDKVTDTRKVDAVIIQQMQIENNGEKEAKIIDLLDQVLQAEEDTYGEAISLKEFKEELDDTATNELGIPHRKSLSELSDAGSDASLGNQGLSKYDVVAQVHREDLPRVSEEEERLESNEYVNDFEDEEITAFNDSDSRTDESGYSDTIDRHVLSESLEDTQLSIIPVPPPPPPPPPPLDEDYCKPNNNVKKFYTVNYRHTEPELPRNLEEFEVTEPRVSIQSNNSQGDGNIRFGSDRQIKFMSKLNDIFQKREEEEEPRIRSHSTGHFPDAELSVITPNRPSMFEDLKKELLSREAAQNLRPVNIEDKSVESDPSEPEEEEEEDISMSRQDLKHKLEGIFAVGGPQLMKPRLMKTDSSPPEEPNKTENNSSSESIAKLPKVDKNDTLSRQRAKFGEVLNSIRMSMNQEDQV